MLKHFWRKRTPAPQSLRITERCPSRMFFLILHGDVNGRMDSPTTDVLQERSLTYGYVATILVFIWYLYTAYIWTFYELLRPLKIQNAPQLTIVKCVKSNMCPVYGCSYSCCCSRCRHRPLSVRTIRLSILQSSGFGADDAPAAPGCVTYAGHSVVMEIELLGLLLIWLEVTLSARAFKGQLLDFEST